MTTPGALRQFAAQADKDTAHYVAMSIATNDPDRKRYFLRCAENRAEHADWYREVASRGEITVEYSEIHSFSEAAE